MTQPVWKYLQGISSFGGDMGVTMGAITGGIAPASAVYPASNDAIYVPFCIHQSVLIKRLFSINGSAVSGNIDMGIYTADGGRLTSIGSTAQSGTSQPQFFDITDLMLGAGLYYLAVALDNTTGTLIRSSVTVPRLQMMGLAKQASAFSLPSTATFATVTATYLPLIGAEIAEIR